MDCKITNYNPDQYHETTSGNKINKKTLISGSDQINTNGKAIMMEGTIIRGDLAKIIMGKNIILHENVVIKPSYRKHKG